MAETGFELSSYGRRRNDMVGLSKVDPEDIILVDGKYGLFTPLTKVEGAEAETERNLNEIIELLRRELDVLTQENSVLKEKLRLATEKPARTPDEFVTAIQHSVDSLQGKLSDMKNPISDFVVSEFNLDSRVFVDVSQFGTIDYRFIQPGDDLDSALLSNLSLKVKPVPKQTQAGSYDKTNFTPYADVDEIQGIGDAYKEKLKAHHIYTVSDLLHAGTRVRSRVELASLLDVEHRSLGEWLSQAELMTEKNIDGRNAEVLFEVGVSNLEALAAEIPETLLEKYNQRVTEKDYASLPPATQEQVENWIHVAKLYVGRTKEKNAESPDDASLVTE